ncbi:hypothetical protein [Haloparvum sp. AD34]
MQKRRTFLGLVTTSAVAGCLGNNSEAELPEILVENLSSEERTVHLLVTDGGEPIFWRTVIADPFDEEANQVGGEVLDWSPDGAGEYVVHARFEHDEEPERFDVREYGADCYRVFVHISEQGTLSIAYTKNCTF